MSYIEKMCSVNWRFRSFVQYSIPVQPTSVCVSMCVSVSTLSYINISETSGPITAKFYLKQRWGMGKAALGFGPGWIGILVSMATDSSHRVIMGKT